MQVGGIGIEEGVVFGKGGGRDLLCDVYTPAAATAGSTSVLLLYGGGWRAGDRSRVREVALQMAGHGFVCVASDYRLTPEAAWPAQIHDVKAAIRWLRANADRLGINPAKITLQGHSAGGHLALLAAGTPGRAEFEGEGGNAGVSTAVAAAVAFYPPVLFYAEGKRPSGASPADSLMGEAATVDLAREASPMSYVTAAFPPTFLLHGTRDDVVPVSASLRFFEALTSVRAPVELKIYAGSPHGFQNQPGFLEVAQAEAAHFLDRHVRRPD
jgi:acetyl esterase/lipase